MIRATSSPNLFASSLMLTGKLKLKALDLHD
jgi:hypothetical protein